MHAKHRNLRRECLERELEKSLHGKLCLETI